MLKARMLGFACASLLFCAAPLHAQTESVRVGGLTCRSGLRVGLIVGSRQDLRCVFRSNSGEEYKYRGTIRRIGLDVGVTRRGMLFWAVFAPNTGIGRGSLRGNYVGVSANIGMGFGVGAKILVGGSRRTISLQPLAVEGQIGSNLAAGVATLVLR